MLLYQLSNRTLGDNTDLRFWNLGDGGKTKPKFFYAHSLTGASSITGLNVLNTPVQAFSIDSSTGLTLADITIDNSAGDANSLATNTDAFDVGSSASITISGAKVQNQDDCLAINSGKVRYQDVFVSSNLLTSYRV
jgi:galacturan 1,4-alpha-galacturonidase